MTDDTIVILDKICSNVTISPIEGKLVNNSNHIELFEHQRENIYGMRKLEIQLSYKKNKLIESMCILSDKVGAGKSYTILELISKYPLLDITMTKFPDRDENIEKLNIYVYDSTVYYKIRVHNALPISLLLVPHSLYKQWEEYIENVKLPYYGINKRKAISKIKNIIDNENISLILVNLNMLEDLTPEIEDYYFSRIIVDESETFTGPKGVFKQSLILYLNSCFKWFLTATPTYTTHSFFSFFFKRGENWNIFKSDDSKVDELMYSTIQKIAKFSITVKQNEYIEGLEKFYPAEALELINAGCIDKAKQIFGDNLCDKDSLATLLVNSIQKKIDILEIRIKNNPDRDEYVKEMSEYTHKLDRVQTRIRELNTNSCMICMEPFKIPVMVSCCDNFFCNNCISNWLKQNPNCPYCRSVIKIDTLQIIIDSKIPKQPIKKNPEFENISKLDHLHNLLDIILEKDHEPKIIIFSDFSHTYIAINEILDAFGLIHTEITGNSIVVRNKLDKFNKGEINVLFLTSKHYGSGLNIQTANYIIMFHRMTIEKETQIIGRSQRFGRDGQLKVIYLQYSNETYVNSDDVIDLDSYDEFIDILE